jgi:precorrin-6Y C5,15-methyltransferase (decarboxylating)
MKFIVIGITDNPQPFFPPEVKDIINQGKVFSGGKRHHEIVASLLPTDAKWIDITVPLDDVFERYKQLSGKTAEQTIIVFASGDPLFFGFANTIQRKMPEAEIKVYPTFNSLQMLAHRMALPYHDMQIVSLTGRDWQKLDEALIRGESLIGILTDRQKNPHTVHQRMSDYGYTNYQMTIGEHLGNPEQERISSYDEKAVYSHPNCIMLQKTASQVHPLGLPDAAFSLLDGREKMITKMPIRLLTLQTLELSKRKVFWDIGFCTGSVSIEAKLQFPHLQIEAFEIRPECEAIIQENARRFGAPDINVHIGNFLTIDISELPRPDAVFIGGHGGHLKEVMAKVLQYLSPDGVIVFNSVTSPIVPTNSRQLWDEACTSLGLRQEPPLHVALNDYNPIDILKASRKP